MTDPVHDHAPIGRIERRLTAALYWLGGTTLILMMLYIVANAVSRTVFRFALPASLEIVQFIMMPLLATLGFVAATLAGRHVTADILYDFFPPAGRKWLVFGNMVLTGATFLVLFYYTWFEAVKAIERDVKAGYTAISIWPIYLLVPVSFIICALLFARDAWRIAHRPASAMAKTEIDVKDAVEHGIFV